MGCSLHGSATSIRAIDRRPCGARVESERLLATSTRVSPLSVIEDDERALEGDSLACMVQFLYPDQDDVLFFVFVAVFSWQQRSHGCAPLDLAFTLAIDPAQPAGRIIDKFREYSCVRDVELELAVADDAGGARPLDDLDVAISKICLHPGRVFVVTVKGSTAVRSAIPTGDVAASERQAMFILNPMARYSDEIDINRFITSMNDSVRLTTQHPGAPPEEVVVPRDVKVRDFEAFLSRCHGAGLSWMFLETLLMFEPWSPAPLLIQSGDRIGDSFRDGQLIEVMHFRGVADTCLRGAVRVIVLVRGDRYTQVFPGALTVGHLLARTTQRGWIAGCQDVTATHRVVQMRRGSECVAEGIIDNEARLADITYLPVRIESVSEA